MRELSRREFAGLAGAGTAGGAGGCGRCGWRHPSSGLPSWSGLWRYPTTTRSSWSPPTKCSPTASASGTSSRHRNRRLGRTRRRGRLRRPGHRGPRQRLGSGPDPGVRHRTRRVARLDDGHRAAQRRVPRGGWGVRFVAGPMPVPFQTSVGPRDAPMIFHDEHRRHRHGGGGRRPVHRSGPPQGRGSRSTRRRRRLRPPPGWRSAGSATPPPPEAAFRSGERQPVRVSGAAGRTRRCCQRNRTSS